VGVKVRNETKQKQKLKQCAALDESILKTEVIVKQ
jgi:hypothetical protein